MKSRLRCVVQENKLIKKEVSTIFLGLLYLVYVFGGGQIIAQVDAATSKESKIGVEK